MFYMLSTVFRISGPAAIQATADEPQPANWQGDPPSRSPKRNQKKRGSATTLLTPWASAPQPDEIMFRNSTSMQL